MSAQHDAFERSIQRCRDLVAVAKYLRSRHVLEDAADDVLRASLAHAVGALDRFVHERVRIGMLAASRGEISRTVAFERFSVPLVNVLRGAEGGLDGDAWLNPAIVEQHERLSFQRPDKLADAIRHIAEIPGGLWPQIADRTGEVDATKAKRRLDLIVDRRNAIVHEDDADPAGSRSPIDELLVNEALDATEQVVGAIDQLIDENT